MLREDPPGGAVPVRWGQVTEVGPVWTEVYSPATEESKPALAAYRLRTAARQTHEISRSLGGARTLIRWSAVFPGAAVVRDGRGRAAP